MPASPKVATTNPTIERQLTYVNLRQFCLRVPEISPYRAKTLAVSGRLRTLVLPGCCPRYCVEDGLRIAEGERMARGAAKKGA